MSLPGEGSLAAFRLDDPELVESGDPGGLLRQIASAAAQVRMSVRVSEEAGLALSRPRTIVVAATGASASAGEVLAALCGVQSPIQVTVVRGHQLPGWVGATDLVICVSASGGGQEILALASEAVRRGCDFLGVGPPRSPLADLAATGRGFFVPVAQGSGRTQLWALTVPLLMVASRLGILRLPPESYEATAETLEQISHQCRPGSESFVNPAKSLALDLTGTLPMIWGGSDLASVAARRFASLLTLNAKHAALSGSFPDVAYSQVAILDGPLVPAPAPVFPEAEDFDLGPDDVPGPGVIEPRMVLISDPAGEHPLITRMRRAASSLAGERGILMSELVMAGEDPFRRLASVVQMLDYTTVYLAIASGLDPLVSPAREDLRDLAGRPVRERSAPDEPLPDGPLPERPASDWPSPDWPGPDRPDGD